MKLTIVFCYTTDRQLAFELASQYKQLILDREFATRLQGLSSERVNIDTQNYKNLLGVINQAEQQRLTVSAGCSLKSNLD